ARIEGVKLLVANYFGELRDNSEVFTTLPVAGLHVDGVRGVAEISDIAARLPNDTVLSVGMVDGRNVWKTDLAAAADTLQQAERELGPDRLMVGPSCSLLHTPVTLRNETKLNEELKSWLAFAEEKLTEIAFLTRAADGQVDTTILEANKQAMATRRSSKM